MANATVLIDDATSTITALHFSETETLEGYYSALQQHLEKYGRPLAIYTDRTTIFSSPKGAGKTSKADRQFVLRVAVLTLVGENGLDLLRELEDASKIRELKDEELKAYQLYKPVAECILQKEWSEKGTKLAMYEYVKDASTAGYKETFPNN